MDPYERNTLLNRQKYLRENLDMQFVIHYFHQYGLINEDEKEEIMSENTKTKQVDKFLSYLWNGKTPELFTTFCRALVDSNNEFIAHDLNIELQRTKASANSLHPGMEIIMILLHLCIIVQFEFFHILMFTNVIIVCY